ncbi:MAG: site-2 protease family protein, partial [Ruminiclostridium sp.]|nr:site-2 protease family protein [Ruminiclostridium sp.]
VLAFQMVININLNLGVFNLLPIPPFDGSRIFFAFLPTKYYFAIMRYERFIMMAVLLLLYTGILSIPFSIVSNLIYTGLDFITGFIC